MVGSVSGHAQIGRALEMTFHLFSANFCQMLRAHFAWQAQLVWASRWSVALRAFYRQILSLTYSFFSLKLPPPACPGTTGRVLTIPGGAGCLPSTVIEHGRQEKISSLKLTVRP